MREISEALGNQAVIGIVDYRIGVVAQLSAISLEKYGAGEILLQCIEREGMMGGYDLDTIRRVSEAVNIPVIASCGAGNYQHMVDAIKAGASAVAAGSIFQFEDMTPRGAAMHLVESGIEARV